MKGEVKFSDIESAAEKFIQKQLRCAKKADAGKWYSEAHRQAAKDAMLYVGRFCDKFKGKRGSEERKALVQSLGEVFRETLHDRTIQAECWRRYVDKRLDVLNIERNSKGKHIDYRLGVWQKYSSMMFKHLYCIQLSCKQDHWFPAEEIEKASCPIDSVITCQVFRKIPDEEEWRRRATGPETGEGMDLSAKNKDLPLDGQDNMSVVDNIKQKERCEL